MITNRVPYPPNSGYPIAVFNTLYGLDRQGAKVSVFALNTLKHFVDPAKVTDPLFERVQLVSSQIDTGIYWHKALLNLFSSASYNISRFWSSAVAEDLRKFLQQNKVDVVQLEGLFVMPYVDVIRKYSQAKIVYRMHNVEYHIWQQLAFAEKNPVKKAYLSLLTRRLHKYEADTLNWPDAIFTMTSVNEAEVRKMGGTKPVGNFPISLNLKNYLVKEAQAEHPGIFHLGSMDWLPNLEALEWFLQNIWPTVTARFPDVKFYIAGRGIPERFTGMGKNVVIVSNVPDAVEFMNSKSIMVVPLLSGSGMRVKILEGLALAKCIVSTTLGAEGIEVTDNNNILLADTPESFADALMRCIADKDLCTRLGNEGRKLIEARYEAEVMAGEMMKFYERL
ncbi:MAG: glycosyltransferase family 4 protein [Mucilaginibacter polytrichastri]|nr:glycosyltransferase family 4 protein [Mucilaginibacter polytrichastri]